MISYNEDSTQLVGPLRSCAFLSGECTPIPTHSPKKSHHRPNQPPPTSAPRSQPAHTLGVIFVNAPVTTATWDLSSTYIIMFGSPSSAVHLCKAIQP